MPATELKAQDLLDFVALLSQPDEDGVPVVTDLARRHPWLAAALDELEEVPLAHWQAEHTRLFVSGHPATVCPPFASAYCHGQMYGPIVGQAQGFFRSLGLEAETGVPGDYLGTILECAAWLLEQDARGSDAWCILWRDFLDPWVPQFAADMQRGARLLLYRELGRRLAWLCRDCRLV